MSAVSRSGRVIKPTTRFGWTPTPNIIKGRAPGYIKNKKDAVFMEKSEICLMKADELAKQIKDMEDEERRSLTPEAEVPAVEIEQEKPTEVISYYVSSVPFQGSGKAYNNCGTDDDWPMTDEEYPRNYRGPEPKLQRVFEIMGEA